MGARGQKRAGEPHQGAETGSNTRRRVTNPPARFSEFVADTGIPICRHFQAGSSEPTTPSEQFTSLSAATRHARGSDEQRTSSIGLSALLYIEPLCIKHLALVPAATATSVPVHFSATLPRASAASNTPETPSVIPVPNEPRRYITGPAPLRFFAPVVVPAGNTPTPGRTTTIRCQIYGCSKAYAYKQGDGTGTIGRHLKIAHRILDEEICDVAWVEKLFANDGKLASNRQLTLDNFVGSVRSTAQDQQLSFLRMVVDCNLPLTFVEQQSVRDYWKLTTLTLPSSSALNDLVLRAHSLSRLNLHSWLQQQEGVSITADHWRSPRGHPILVVTAHFLDRHFSTASCILAVREAPHPHIGDAIASQIADKFGVIFALNRGC